jgi:hypothetical protein
MRSELMQEYNALSEQWKSAQRDIKIHDVPQLKRSLKCAREFLDRWQYKHHKLADERMLSELRNQHRRIMAILESWFLEALHRVIDERVRWLIAEHRFSFSVEYIQMVQNARSDLRPRLLALFWNEFGYEFDPGRLYQNSEAAADQCERVYKQAFCALKTNWPERMNVQLNRRLAGTDPGQLRGWKATLPMPVADLWKVAL